MEPSQGAADVKALRTIVEEAEAFIVKVRVADGPSPPPAGQASAKSKEEKEERSVGVTAET